MKTVIFPCCNKPTQAPLPAEVKGQFGERLTAAIAYIRLEGMAEAFNSLNHRNDMIPNATWGTGAYPNTPNATFGQATAVGDPRSVQLAARLSF